MPSKLCESDGEIAFLVRCMFLMGCAKEVYYRHTSLNLKEKTLGYRFRVIHIPGVKHRAADAISRHPTGEPVKMDLPDDVAPLQYEIISADLPTLAELRTSFLAVIRCGEVFEDTTELSVQNSAISALSSLCSVKAITWDGVRVATNNDEVMVKLIEIIPPSLRSDVLESLHAAHQGVSSMISRAEHSVFSPRITPAITDLRNRCNDCNRMAPSQPSAPPSHRTLPVYSFQGICSDVFTYKGMSYSVSADRYSNWQIVERSSGGAQGLIASLRQIFGTFGIADELSSDGVPPA